MAGNPAAAVEVSGTFVDVGRLTDGDPRLMGVDAARLSQARFGKPWPGVGELLLLVVASVAPADPFPAPSIRALALRPGAVPGRPGHGRRPVSRPQSVWRSARCARPQQLGFRAAGRRRVCVGDGPAPARPGVQPRRGWRGSTRAAGWRSRRLVRRERHLVLLEATSVRLAEPPAPSAAAEPVARVPVAGPRPVVVFSAPTQDETDVAPGTRVRIQFSRDLDRRLHQGPGARQLRRRSVGRARRATAAVPRVHHVATTRARASWSCGSRGRSSGSGR